MNSKLMTFYHQKKFLDEFKMRFQKILIKDCKCFPIRPINFSDPVDKARHDRMVSLVERMLELHKRTPSALAGTSPNFQNAEFRGGGRTPQEQEMVKREIEATDRAIDRLVYELYGLTEEEIKIVEGV
jgi:hypothetical protein